MHFPRNRTRWDKYMLQDISNYNFYGRSELVRLRGKYTVQTAHCALECSVHSVLGSILAPHVPIPDTSDPPTVVALPAERELHFLPFLSDPGKPGVR